MQFADEARVSYDEINSRLLPQPSDILDFRCAHVRSFRQMNVKLTDEHGQTFGGMQWGPGVTHGPTMGGNRPLCTIAWLHLYEGLGLAILHNPLGAAFSAPRFWRVSRDTRIERREGL